MPFLNDLAAYYEQMGISPANFRCSSFCACSAGSSTFAEAKASFVGPRYGEEGLPRLLFLSLKPRRPRLDWQCRTPAAVRSRMLAIDVETLPMNSHWYRTHEMALALLRQFKPTLTVADTRFHFAHVNSAKCCPNKHDRSENTDQTLVGHCRRFIPGELEILGPEIIVTQGRWARKALSQFGVREHVRRKVAAPDFKRDARYETGLIDVAPRRKASLWLHTCLPGDYGRFHPQRVHCWPRYAEVVHRFWKGR